MRIGRAVLAALFFAAAVPCFAADVVVLRGGVRIDLLEAPKQQGNTAILTRSDGTVLSVSMSEIDWKATSAERNRQAQPKAPAIVAPPSSPVDAVRTGKEEKARVHVTDADVGHVTEEAALPGEKKPSEMPVGSARVEVGQYNQQKSGSNVIVTGQLVNPGTSPANNVKLTVTALDADGNTVSAVGAVLATGTIEGGRSVSFSASVPIGDRTLSTIRFSPQWQVPPPPPGTAVTASAPGSTPGAPAAGNGAPASASTAASAAAPASRPPAPAPTPYGRGTLYANPPPSAPSSPPADGNTGYIPGATSPDNQPKPPQ